MDYFFAFCSNLLKNVYCTLLCCNISPKMTLQGGVQKLRRQNEVGRWSAICLRLVTWYIAICWKIFKNAYSRGVGGQNSAKFGLCSFWTTLSMKSTEYSLMGGQKSLMGGQSSLMDGRSLLHAYHHYHHHHHQNKFEKK